MAKPSARRSSEIVVFWTIQDSECSECGDFLGKGRFLVKSVDGVACLPCADLDHLVFLARGDAALTRRASKHSTLRAVVVRFARARKRYERQGVLVERKALERAEQECLDDAEARRRKREREAERRAVLDEAYVAAFAERVRARYPGAPEGTQKEIAVHACAKYSGRVGRTAAAKDFDPAMIDLAVVAHVRHVHTDYDGLLARGEDRHAARKAVGDEVRTLLERWRVAK